MPDVRPPAPARSWLSRIFPKLWRDDPELLWPYFLRPFVVPIVNWLAPSHCYGADRVPLSGGCVLAANHLSAVDPALIGGLCPRTVWYMAKVELLAMPVIGEGLQWTGAFPVRRGEGDRDALRRARELVREGHMVGVFLEGTRQRFGYPGEIQPGGMMIALQEGVPVVPCGAYSFGWTRKNHMPCAVVFGDAMTFESVAPSGRGYKQAAELVGGEVLKLWRQAAEAVAARFPLELPDGARRGDIYPPFRRTGPR